MPEIESFKVQIRHEKNGELLLRYRVKAKGGELVLPAPQFPARKDGLWQQSCCELFVCPAGQQGYYEFNFSPSSLWAAYGFSGYRDGMSEVEAMLPPRISTKVMPDGFDVSVLLAPGLLAFWPNWQIGLSAVMVAKDGRKSYWALAHSPGAPDFHHRDCFAGQLSPVKLP